MITRFEVSLDFIDSWSWKSGSVEDETKLIHHIEFLFITRFEVTLDFIDSRSWKSGSVEDESKLIHRKDVSARVAIRRKLLASKKLPKSGDFQIFKFSNFNNSISSRCYSCLWSLQPIIFTISLTICCKIWYSLFEKLRNGKYNHFFLI